VLKANPGLNQDKLYGKKILIPIRQKRESWQSRTATDEVFIRGSTADFGMKFIRRLHLPGRVLRPLLLFYVATGWCQTVTIQRNKSSGQPGDWVSNLSQVHVDQIYPTERGSQNGYSPAYADLSWWSCQFH
jgi:hypothetical protein